MNSRRAKATIVLIIIAILLISGCSNNKSIESYKEEVETLRDEIRQKDDAIKEHREQIDKLKNDIADSNSQLHRLRTENNSLKGNIEKINEDYYTSELKRLFSTKELEELAGRVVKYDLALNDIRFSNGTMRIPRGGIEVVLREYYDMMLDELENYPLPTEIINMGFIKGDGSPHIKIETDLDYDEHSTAGTTVSAIIYEFKNVKSGSTIKLIISDQLKKRLGLENNTLEIIVE